MRRALYAIAFGFFFGVGYAKGQVDAERECFERPYDWSLWYPSES